MTVKRRRRLDVETETDNRLGQVLAAFGYGAGGMRVSRSTVQALRERFRERIRRQVVADPDAWVTEGVHVLDLARGIGRLAALHSTERGWVTVRAEAFTRAAGTVERVTPKLYLVQPTNYCTYGTRSARKR